MNNSNTETYNGWTNYATWRVNMEIFSGLDREEMETVTAESCREYAEMITIDEVEPYLARDYASAFLSQVNWHEIAEMINEN